MTEDYPYEAETDGVVVRVAPAFIDEESSPEDHRFMWSYRIQIENRAGRTLQLKTRYWRITDCDGRVQEVNGAGVVGQQPVLPPGGSFEYASGAPLTVPSGAMVTRKRTTPLFSPSTAVPIRLRSCKPQL